MSKTVNIRPLADRVLVEPAAAEEKTAGGIIIPDTAKEKPQKGKIIAVGTGKKDEPMTVKVGYTGEGDNNKPTSKRTNTCLHALEEHAVGLLDG